MFFNNRIFGLCVVILFFFIEGLAQPFQPLQIASGFNHDVIANGPGPAVNSSTAGVDSTGLTWANCLMSQDFQPTAAPPPAYALPVNGVINSAATAGLTFQMAPYNSNNSLWLNYQNSGVLTLATPTAASKLYILMTSGHGASTANGIIHFADNTTQNFGVINCPDWFNGTNPPPAITGIGRVFRATNAIDNAFGNPRLYQYMVNIAPANIQKQIVSVQFNKTSQLSVLNIFAISAELSPCPSLNLFANDFQLCPGDDSTLVPIVNNAISYQWSDGSISPTLMVNQPGTYWVTIQTAQCTYRDTISAILPNLILPFTLGADTQICQNTSITLSPDVQQTGDYLWSDGSVNPSITVGNPGIYWLEITGECGSYRDSIQISLLPNPTSFSLGDDIVFCSGDSPVLSTPPQDGMSYLWQNGTTQNTLPITTPGVYWLRIYNQCQSVTDTLIASIPNAPIAILPLDTILCDNATLTLSPILQHHQGSYWQDGTSTPSYSVTHAGTYTIFAYNQCDTISDSMEVQYLNSPIVQLGSDLTPCEGEVIQLEAYGNAGNYIWPDGSIGSSFSISQSGIYWAKASNFCGTMSDSIEVRYIMKPIADLGPDQLLCMDESIELKLSNPRAYYLWSTGSTESSILVTQAGQYAVRAYNQCGEANDTISVQFNDCSCAVFLPNAFTPDNDGINDFFMPGYHCDFEWYELRIFNQWGQKIFESFEPDQPWDGSCLGGEYYVKSGVYSYLLTYKTVNSLEPISIRGSVAMLR